MFDPMPEYIDNASFCDLTLESGQKSSPCRTIVLKIEGLDQRSVRVENKVTKLREVYRILAVVILGIAENPTGPAESLLRIGCFSRFKRFAPCRACQRGDDQAFEALFAGVGGHAMPYYQIPIKYRGLI
jgi:hypothetical protein